MTRLTKEDRLLKLINKAQNALELAVAPIEDKDGETARSKLSDASNLIDDAMGIIDELMAPEPTIWDDPHLP